MSIMHDFNLDDKYIRQVPDWPYWITIDGEIFNQHGQQLKPCKDTRPGKGHLTVQLWNGGKKKRIKIHILVMELFVGPRPKGLEVRHLDGNPENNHVRNLKYGSSSENKLDQVRHGRHAYASRTHCANGHEYTEENTKISIETKPSGRITRVRRCLSCRRREPEQFDEWKDLIALLPELLELEAWEYAA